jgi:hypothetical protein
MYFTLVVHETLLRRKTTKAIIVRARVAKFLKPKLKSTDMQIACLIHEEMANGLRALV